MAVKTPNAPTVVRPRRAPHGAVKWRPMRTLDSIDTGPLRRDARRALKRARRRPLQAVEFRAQFGEDALIWALCDEALDGFFVEAGAFDGYQASVTYALECLGWRGLLVEPNPSMAEACRERRTNSRVVHAALGASTGDTSFVVTSDGSGGMFSHVPERGGTMKRQRVLHQETVTVPLTTLNELLAGHEGDIDAVSLDVEGFELEVLAGFDLRLHRPKVLLLEDNPRRPNEAMVAHMATQPYVQIAWLRVNRVYVRSDLVSEITTRLGRLGDRRTASADHDPFSTARLEAWRALKARIPGRFVFARTYDRAVAAAKDDAIFVEVGSGKGQSAFYMASQVKASGKRIRFHCIDHWLGSDEHGDDRDLVSGTPYDTFLRNVADVREYLEPLRLPSLEAATRFDDDSCALALVAARHQYAEVRADIMAWWPKVASGGILAGDDYEWPDVQRAVHEVFGDRVEVVGISPRRHWRVVK